MSIYKQYLKLVAESHDNIVEEIKQYLCKEWDCESYEQFVNQQSMGDCQSIVADIKREFPQVMTVFGEIEVDESYIDEDGDEQILMTHHWVKINGAIYDFSKGTLKRHISWADIYDPAVDGEEWRYQ